MRSSNTCTLTYLCIVLGGRLRQAQPDRLNHSLLDTTYRHSVRFILLPDCIPVVRVVLCQAEPAEAYLPTHVYGDRLEPVINLKIYHPNLVKRKPHSPIYSFGHASFPLYSSDMGVLKSASFFCLDQPFNCFSRAMAC